MNLELPISIPDFIINDVFDNEVVVVNLHSGSYYSLTGIAASLWIEILQGSTRQVLIDMLDQVAADTHIDRFLQILAGEGLFAGRDTTFSSLDEEAFAKSLESSFFNGLIEKHTDVEALLLIDPIHEVDSSGWPNLI